MATAEPQATNNPPETTMTLDQARTAQIDSLVRILRDGSDAQVNAAWDDVMTQYGETAGMELWHWALVAAWPVKEDES